MYIYIYIYIYILYIRHRASGTKGVRLTARLEFHSGIPFWNLNSVRIPDGSERAGSASPLFTTGHYPPSPHIFQEWTSTS